MMKRYDTPYVADWFVISLRWTALIGMVASLGLGHKLAFSVTWPLVLLGAWNLSMTAFAGLNTRPNYQRYLNLLIDLVLAGAFFWVQGKIRGPAFWAGLLPILTGAIYFEWVGAALTAILFSGLVIYVGVTENDLYLALGITIGLCAFGGVFGFLGRRLSDHLRKNRAFWADAEEKKHAIQNERMRAIYELTSELSSTLSYKRVLDSAMNMSARALNPSLVEENEQTSSDPLVGAMMLFNGGKLQIGSARRFTTADMRIEFSGEEGVLKKALDEGDPVAFKDIGYDPELGRVVALRNCTSGYVFPLRSGFNVYGAMLFAHPDADYFNAERANLLDIIGRQSVIAIQNARLYQDLVEEKERMADVYEETRKKLARDLHDGPTQSIAAMAMRINIARRMLAKDAKMASEELVKLEELAHRTTKEIRHMLFTLRPLILESQGLDAAVKSMAEKMQETYDQKVAVEINANAAEQLEMGKQGVLFYIIEEAVNNARKHAKAPVIAVRLRQAETGLLLLEIQDNGEGFDVQAMSQNYEKRANSSLGMVNLRERTELVNGVLNIDSAPGKGTNVQVFIPLTEEAADRLHYARRNS
ncbi:MAG: GAF domain-containing sensor histidine kinase [Anaerolineales bacterium]|nr:GAF domain-containing sensor histidine kinase [Anaerolineales bacterium]